MQSERMWQLTWLKCWLSLQRTSGGSECPPCGCCCQRWFPLCWWSTHTAHGQLLQHVSVCNNQHTRRVVKGTKHSVSVESHTHTHTQELVLVPSWWTGGCSTAVSHDIKLNKIYISAVSAADLEEDWCCGCCCRCCRVGSPPQDQNNPGWEQRSLC